MAYWGLGLIPSPPPHTTKATTPPPNIDKDKWFNDRMRLLGLELMCVARHSKDFFYPPRQHYILKKFRKKGKGNKIKSDASFFGILC